MRTWTLGQELRQAVRAWRRHPGPALTIVGLLALGIGATTTSATVVKRVLLDPLPYPDADALVRLAHDIGGIDQPYFNDPVFLTYAGHSQAFASVGAWSPSALGATVTGHGDPEHVRTLTATSTLYRTLGVAPVLGRAFTAEDDAPGAPDTALISTAYWQRALGGARDAIGRTLLVDGRPHTIVGVMPAHFRFDGEADVLLPLRIDAARPVPFFYLNGVARLRPGTTLDAARADVARLLELYFDTYRVNPTRAVRWTPALRPLRADVVGDAGPTLWALLGAVALVLVMACANVATLLLVRGAARQRELAIHAALGASRARLARTALLESLVLAGAGGALGVAGAAGALRLLRAAAPDALPRAAEIAFDPAVAIAAVAASLLCGVSFGLVPVLRFGAARFTTAAALGARSATATRERQRGQRVLVAVQVALAVVLLVGAGLMLRSAAALRQVDPGFVRPQHLQTFTASMPAAVYADLEAVTRRQQAITEALAALPGVEAVSFTTRLPMDPTDRWSAALAVDGMANDGRTPPNRQVKVVAPGSFRTLGTPLVAGRDFTWTDLYEQRDVAIVSENLARELWGAPAAALGKRVRQFYGTPGPWQEVIGVAGDVHDDGVHVPAPATVYWPARLDDDVFAGYQPRRISVMIRSARAGTASFAGEVRRAVRDVDRALPVADLQTLEPLYAGAMSRTSFTLALMAAAAAVALVLGVSGLYGVVAYAVAQRRREIGIRLALGAADRQIRGLFLRHGLLVVAAGLGGGLAGAAAAARVMASLLFGVAPTDLLTFVAAPLVLGTTAVLATYLPARRAMRVDPVETMKAE